MKKSTSLIAGFMALSMLLSACTSGGEAKDIDVAATSKSMMEATTFSDDMVLLSEKVVANYYDLENVDEMAVYICPTGGYAEEVALFKAKDGKAEDLKTEAQAHIDARKAEFEGYVPAEVFKLENAKILTNGNYVAVIVADDTAQATAEFEKAFE